MPPPPATSCLFGSPLERTQIDQQERFRGCLLGLAVGGAVGTLSSFVHGGGFEPLREMIGGGPFHLRAGQWTDDTSMALCLETSLVECKGFGWWLERDLEMDRDSLEQVMIS